jgi:protein-disulfide isomerase/uncharacterized membrane protein
MKRGALGLLLALMLFGVFVGGLMTWHHETQLYAADAQAGALIGCAESASVNCDIVNTSEWSELGGIPIATLGIGFYATCALLAGLALRGRDSARTLLVVGGVFAVGLSAVLYSVSKNELGYVCAWCLRLYGVNTSLLVLSLLGGKPPLPDGRTFGTAVGAFLALNVLAVGGERAYRHTLTGDGDGPALAAAGGKLTHDPRGKAPTRSFTVTTEDKNEATFSLTPDDAWAGNPDAKVAVVMFGDLECGYCKRSSAEIGRLYEAYSDRVLFVFKHFPMNPDCNDGVKNKKHHDACIAAEAAVCAKEQGLFWPFHDLAYKNQHQLGADSLRTYAVQVGADGAKYDACLADGHAEMKVRADAAVGTSLDIHGTPRIFINGKLYRSGSSAEAMAKEIETALGATAADAVAKAKALHEVEDVAAIPADVPATRALSIGGLAFSIDTFEASVVDGAAVSTKHAVPALRTSWYTAKAACEKAGRHLCSEEEWVSACQNARAVDDNKNGELADDMIEGTAYPYGDYHDDGRCWDAKEGDAFRPVYTGEMPGCATPTGVYDMTGNVEEWVGDSPEHAVLLGGAWDTSEDHARCYRRNDTFGPGYASARTGFRCCSE